MCGSTCSVHAEENEAVVAAVLKAFPEWSLEEAIPGWHRRGIACEGLAGHLARCCLRVDPLLDQAHGFFVACLTKKPEGGAQTMADMA
jgi:16S rRNA C967 or C1407 C5-methylase (RsmB/RsmF family)